MPNPTGERFHKPRDWTAKLVPSIDLQEIEIVRWLFNTYATTERSARSMCVELNRRNVPAPNGKEWEYTQIKKILMHPVYIGWLTYGRRGVGLYYNVGADGELTPARPEGIQHGKYAPIIVKDNHEPLIDKPTFDAVQVKRQQRSVVHGGPYRKYLLSGILRCGHCGGLLLATSGSPGSAKRNPPYAYYKCKRARVSGTCANYAARADLVEPRIIECFRSVWQTEPAKKKLRKALVSLADETARGRPARRTGLAASIDKLDLQITKGSENLLLLAPVDIPAASAMLGQWREQRNQLQAELDTEQQDAPAPYDVDAIMAELDELGNHITGDSIPLPKAVFHRVFESISLYWEQVSPRRRELVRAEILPLFPFRLTTSTSTRRGKRRKSLKLYTWV